MRMAPVEEEVHVVRVFGTLAAWALEVFATPTNPERNSTFMAMSAERFILVSLE